MHWRSSSFTCSRPPMWSYETPMSCGEITFDTSARSCLSCASAATSARVRLIGPAASAAIDGPERWQTVASASSRLVLRSVRVSSMELCPRVRSASVVSASTGKPSAPTSPPVSSARLASAAAAAEATAAAAAAAVAGVRRESSYLRAWRTTCRRLETPSGRLPSAGASVWSSGHARQLASSTAWRRARFWRAVWPCRCSVTHESHWVRRLESRGGGTSTSSK
mmetsp:Transcript_3648/g.7594  ORF Transcript_3648/g.7594 Transcript_3648/m.7594 type:complete len:223 (-) Transcript_3648:782-1450(-)